MKKRIVIFGVKYFPSKGGTSRVVENLLTELKDEFDITIYCYKNPKATDHIPGIKVIQFPEIPIKGIGVFLYYLLCCIHLMTTRSKYDLVHLHKTDAAIFLPIIEWKFNTVSTSHAMPYLDSKWSGIAVFYFKLAERMFMRSKGDLTTVSKAQADYYYRTYGRKVHYIPNGIQIRKKENIISTTDLLKSLEIKPGYLLFAARRIIPLKGCHTLIEALKLINYHGTVVIAGDTHQLPSYTKQLQKASKGLDIKFIGYISDPLNLDTLVKNASIFVFPSEIEGMSMMLLETGALGTPIICSDIPPNKAVLSEKEALFFESKNAKDLSEKIIWAFDHTLEMKEMARKTRCLIHNTYSISIISKLYQNLYYSLLCPNKSNNYSQLV